MDKFPLESTTISIRSVVSWPAKFYNTQTLRPRMIEGG